MAIASDNPFPKVILSEGTTPASPSAGAQKLFIDSTDHKLKRVNSSGTVTTIEGGTSGTTVPSAVKSRTAGNVGITAVFSTAYAAVDTTLDITLAAAVGDLIEVGVSTFWLNEAATGMLDVASVVSGSTINFWSGGTGSREGVNAWQGPGSVYMPIGGAVMRALVSGDISGGSVTLRLMGATSGGTKTLVAATTKPLQFWAKNLGH